MKFVKTTECKVNCDLRVKEEKRLRAAKIETRIQFGKCICSNYAQYGWDSIAISEWCHSFCSTGIPTAPLLEWCHTFCSTGVPTAPLPEWCNKAERDQEEAGAPCTRCEVQCFESNSAFANGIRPGERQKGKHRRPIEKLFALRK